MTNISDIPAIGSLFETAGYPKLSICTRVDINEIEICILPKISKRRNIETIEFLTFSRFAQFVLMHPY
jgi:hypothetical protein